MDENQIPNPYTTQPQQPQQTATPRQKTGFATAALVFGILSIIALCCCSNVFFAPLAIIFGLIAIARKQGAKGRSITGIVLASLSLLVTLSIVISLKDFAPYLFDFFTDYAYIQENEDEVFAAYEADQTLPECLNKYKEPPYTDLFGKYDFTINTVMDFLDEMHKQGSLPQINIPAGLIGSKADSEAASPALSEPAPTSE